MIICSMEKKKEPRSNVYIYAVPNACIFPKHKQSVNKYIYIYVGAENYLSLTSKTKKVKKKKTEEEYEDFWERSDLHEGFPLL